MSPWNPGFMTMLAAAPVQQVTPILFLAFAAMTVASAWAIVASPNIVRMATYLLLTLTGVAGMYFMLGAELLAAVQLIVYAGGTLILIVFGVMLTASNPGSVLKPCKWEWAAGLTVAAAMALLLTMALVYTPMIWAYDDPVPVASSIEGYGQVAAVGRALLSDYLVAFEVAGVLLLVVMIGAAYMARKRAGGQSGPEGTGLKGSGSEQ